MIPDPKKKGSINHVKHFIELFMEQLVLILDFKKYLRVTYISSSSSITTVFNSPISNSLLLYNCVL